MPGSTHHNLQVVSPHHILPLLGLPVIHLAPQYHHRRALSCRIRWALRLLDRLHSALLHLAGHHYPLLNHLFSLAPWSLDSAPRPGRNHLLASDQRLRRSSTTLMMIIMTSHMTERSLDVHQPLGECPRSRTIVKRWPCLGELLLLVRCHLLFVAPRQPPLLLFPRLCPKLQRPGG